MARTSRRARKMVVDRRALSPSAVLATVHGLVTLALLFFTGNGRFVILYLLFFTVSIGIIIIVVLAVMNPLCLWRREAVGYATWGGTLALQLMALAELGDRPDMSWRGPAFAALAVMLVCCILEAGWLAVRGRFRWLDVDGPAAESQPSSTTLRPVP